VSVDDRATAGVVVGRSMRFVAQIRRIVYIPLF
jgi:hypothetical protein